MNNKLKVIIIDDEIDARAVLRLLLKSIGNVEILADAFDVESGIAAIKAHQPDVIFLDVQMNEKTGFDLLDQIDNPKFQIIFCTGYDQYALKAIKKNALDYLLKPLDPEEVKLAVQKALKNKTNKIPQRISILLSGELFFIETDKICHIESDGAYTTLLLSDGKRFLQVRSLREFEELLPNHRFVRTHQSHIVNIDFVERLQQDTLTLKVSNGIEIPIARRRRASVQEALRLG